MLAWVIATTITFTTLAACGRAPNSPQEVAVQYDKTTGELSQLTISAAMDGKPNITSHMNGKIFLRIDIDQDENGTIDRWEYYSEGQRLEKVGISRSNDGIEDAWLFKGPDGSPAKIERSTRRDGKVDRREFYSKGELTQVEADTDADGRVDKWETYIEGVLTTVSFDRAGSGKPTVTIDYRQK